MRPHPDQLAALAAVVQHGTFEAAARRLHVTASAVSQRIRALETAAGQVLVRRTTPVQPTPAGETLLRLARQAELLYDEARRALDGAGRPVRLEVAVNADSLATWFRPVLGEVAAWRDVSLGLHVEDQAWTADLLRTGSALAAVTSDGTPVQGCTVERLGVLRYRPAAEPGFARRWRAGRGQDWAAMPVVVFNDKDALQHDVLRARGVTVEPATHRVPTSADFLAAVEAGLGWGMVPEPQLSPALARGALVALPGGGHVDVELHWQRWRLASPVLDRLTDSVRVAARSLRRREARRPR